MFRISSNGLENMLLAVLVMSGTMMVCFRVKKVFLKLDDRALLVGLLLLALRFLLPIEFRYTHPIRLPSWYEKLTLFFWKRHVFSLSDSVSIGKVFLVVWFIGAIISFTRRIHEDQCCKSFLSVYARDVTIDSLGLIELSAEDRKLLKKRNVLFKEAPGISSPVLYGIRSPVILLPENITRSSSLTAEEKTIAIRHELWHLKGHDLVCKRFLRVVCALNWWNPLSYLMREQFSMALELRADRETSKKSGGGKSYVHMLMHTAECIGGMSPSENKISEPVARLFSSHESIVRRAEKILFGKRSCWVNIMFLSVVMSLFVFSWLFILEPKVTLGEPRYDEDGEQRFYLSEIEDGKLICIGPHEYEVWAFGVCLETVHSLEGFDETDPMYNSKGEQIKWPFFHE